MALYALTDIKCLGKKGKCDRKLYKESWGSNCWRIICLECGFSDSTVTDEQLKKYEESGEICR